MKVFLDANILFSAASSDSAMAAFLRLIEKEHALFSSTYAIAEAAKNIQAKRPHLADSLDALLNKVSMCPHAVLDADISLAEKDRPILASAIAGKCDTLVTGDKRDFGHLFGKTIQGVRILSPAQLAEALLPEG